MSTDPVVIFLWVLYMIAGFGFALVVTEEIKFWLMKRRLDRVWKYTKTRAEMERDNHG